MTRTDPLASPLAKARLAAVIVWLYGRVRWLLWRRTIPEAAATLRAWRGPVPAAAPTRLGRTVERVLAVGPYRARCLHTSFVHFALLRSRGEEPELVIGLPERPATKDAHAWVEIDGTDVGPPPGRGQHVELARYR
ncbi:MAG TPA: lasso peptide biosynthesis B2 protein [Actinomycetota bacterium]|nr:lasso peptide biosynthesis B2 protein [Actinomycetota bacterium]